MALITRVAVTARDQWSSPHSTSEGHREQKAVTLQPMTCVHTQLQHNAHPLNEGTAHRLCKKRNTHRILGNINCDENTDFKDLTAKQVNKEIFITLAQPSLTLEMLSRHSYRQKLTNILKLVIQYCSLWALTCRSLK